MQCSLCHEKIDYLLSLSFHSDKGMNTHKHTHTHTQTHILQFASLDSFLANLTSTQSSCFGELWFNVHTHAHTHAYIHKHTWQFTSLNRFPANLANTNLWFKIHMHKHPHTPSHTHLTIRILEPFPGKPGNTQNLFRRNSDSKYTRYVAITWNSDSIR